MHGLLWPTARAWDWNDPLLKTVLMHVWKSPFFQTNYKISLWWFTNQEFSSCWCVVCCACWTLSHFVVLPLLCWLTWRCVGSGNSFHSQSFLLLVMKVNALVLAKVHNVNYWLSLIFKKSLFRDLEWEEQRLVESDDFLMLMTHSLVWNFK